MRARAISGFLVLTHPAPVTREERLTAGEAN
jgi:hypothetical protein